MATIGENIRTVLLADSTGVNAIVDGRVHQNNVPESIPMPRVWYTRAASFEDVDNAGVGGLTDSSWDIECHAEDLGDALNLADKVKSLLNGTKGSFGDDSVQGVFVEDHDDDYLPKGIGEDDDSHIHVASISAQIWH